MIADDKLLDQFGAKDRRWGLAILRTVDALGGTARAKDVKAALRARFGDQLPGSTWDWIEETNRVGWTRFRLIEQSLLSGEQRGSWTLTEKGRQALAECAGEVVDLSAESPPGDRTGSATEPAESDDGDAGDLETVNATAYQGWMFPALEAIVAGHSTRKAILEGRFALIVPVTTWARGVCVATTMWMPAARAFCVMRVIASSTSTGAVCIRSASSSTMMTR